MKDLYLAVRNSILFYFIIILAGSALVMPTSFAEKLFVGLIFGIIITLIPHILKFFKLPVNAGAVLLLCIILSFVFFMLMTYVLNLIQFTSRLPDLLVFLGVNSTIDKLMSIVYMTAISSLVILGFDSLEKNA